MPSIRHVCSKVGIDHSTLYRWMSKHHSFYLLVTGALNMGRDRVSEAAESVIIRGIQDNDRKSAAYWLSHNDQRYSSREQARYLHSINERVMATLEEPTPNGSEATFDIYFDAYESMQKVFGHDSAKERIDKLVKFACHEDPTLEEIFYAAYSEWKTNKDELERKERDAGPTESSS
ncbi:MAG: hypothetical protein WC375_02765 [Methanomassiliicoccales archaeon]